MGVGGVEVVGITNCHHVDVMCDKQLVDVVGSRRVCDHGDISVGACIVVSEELHGILQCSGCSAGGRQ